jgi:hypothetical protein
MPLPMRQRSSVVTALKNKPKTAPAYADSLRFALAAC